MPARDCMTPKTCPFRQAYLALALIPACFDDPAIGGAGLDASTSVPDATSSTAATGAPTTAPDESSSGGPGFIHSPDVPDAPHCDLWKQDCPEGQKFAPVSLDGDGSWDALRCVRIVDDPAQAGEACTDLRGPSDGLDTCAEGQLCWNVGTDGKGVCFALCAGSQEAPTCLDPATECTYLGESNPFLCLVACDPLQQDCPSGQLCMFNPVGSGQRFHCTYDAGGDADGQAFAPCAYFNVCDPGLACLDPALASECDPEVDGCCLPFCDLGVEPDICPGAGQTCLPWFDEGAAPPGLAHVGVCGLPD